MLNIISHCIHIEGWASFQAEWPGRDWGSPYAVIWADISDYIAARTPPTSAPTPEKRKKTAPSDSKSKANGEKKKNAKKMRRLKTRNENYIYNKKYKEV